MNQVMCERCGWKGSELELEPYRDGEQMFYVCPNCVSDEYLEDVREDSE